VAYALPGALNTYIPTLNGYAVGFASDPTRYHYARYTQFIRNGAQGSEADGGPGGHGGGRKLRPYGLYKIFDSPSFVRHEGGAGSAGAGSDNYAWPYGQPRPKNYFNIPFKDVEYRCQRRQFDAQLDRETVQFADWQILPMYNLGIMTQAAINRAVAVQSILQTSSNWPGTNTAAANTLNGGAGKWNLGSGDESSPNFLAIKKTLNRVAVLINLYTNGVLKEGDLRLLVSPNDAYAMANTGEIQSYMKNNEHAVKQLLEQGFDGRASKYGLPPVLYGWEVVVEDSIRTSTKLTSTDLASTGFNTDQSFLWSDGTAVCVARQAVEGVAGMPSFSTIGLFISEDMTSEMFDDEENRLVNSYVTDAIQAKLVSPLSGFCITAIT
jgi:hypothetical protein